MRNLAFQIAYDGSAFHGYGIQPDQRTVQGVFEAALQRLLKDTDKTLCAGRTDAGVHALAQLVQTQTAHPMPLERMAPVLNKHLNGEIQVLQAFELPPEFNARYSCKARHYRYVVYQDPTLMPVYRHQFWHCPEKLDLALLKQVWESIQGHHNFKSLCKTGSYRVNFEIDVLWTQCQLRPPFLIFDILAPSFLYNMVRGLVGTTVEIARGRYAPDHMQVLLDAQDQRLPKLIAPPGGLYFFNAVYPREYGIFMHQPMHVHLPWFLK